MSKVLNSKLVVMWEYQNINMFLGRATLQIGLNGHMLLVILID